jgi:ATP-binding cassette subfamily F protein uup
MHYLSVEGLTKAYGIRSLFDHIFFNLSEGDKTALVGRNGSGKSTLLHILAGREEPDEGSLWISKDIRVAYLEQSPTLNENRTVIENIFDHDHPMLNAIRDYESALSSDPLLEPKALDNAIVRMDEMNAWDFESRVNQILGKLGITYLHQPSGTLSGGQRKRIALAKLLIDTGLDHKHSLLIMDEPTNHLDVQMIEWLEQYLSRERVSVLMVTHDRYFLDRVCNQILELDRGKLYAHRGNYQWFLEKKAAREAAEKSGADKAANLLRKELEWIRRQPKARTSKSKSRIDAYYDLEKRAAGPEPETRMEISGKMSRLGGKVLELKKVHKAFGEKVILNGFDYIFKKGERMGIIGDNGTGKTTFLNLVQGKERADSGKINIGETVVFGNYAQEGLLIKDDQRVIEYVKNIAEYFPLADGTKMSASEFLNLFLFPPEQQYTYLTSLSGGEKKRLQLLTVLFRNPNFLLMDEPTNDLDLQTLDILNEFLMQFQGCVVIVSHDRYFMDRLVDHLLIFEGQGKIRDFPGNYSQYRDQLRKDIRKLEAVIVKKPQPHTTKAPVKSSYRGKRELEEIEYQIGILEKEKKVVEASLSSDQITFIQLSTLTSRLAQVISQLNEKTDRWIQLSEPPE